MEKKIRQTFFAFLNVYYPKTQLIKALTLLILQGQMEDYHRIQKLGGSIKLFPPENDFKI